MPSIQTTMAKNPHIFLPYVLLLSSSLLQGILAVQYKVTNKAPNTPGGRRFDTEIGVPFTLQTMGTINNFIWKLFRQPSDSQRKYVPVLNVYISNFNDAFGYTNGDNINISTIGLQSFPPGRAKFEFTSLMYHEMTHIFQWSGQGTAPGGLTEGIADYVMIKSTYYDPEGYTKPGQGGRWDEGYGVTARFLEYCDSLRNGFTPELNNKMRKVYKDEYFQELLGKPLRQVWSEYKAKYGNIPAGSAGGAFSDHLK
ncbi:UNVERIFIED_CONTAM: Basic secretory protease [Sesamum radiatum]|uniref:Basic secretory protease n=1 Tax=Sesamum radiatum TaxID=300843 RepID=A0AAW2RVT8_SESRA